MLRRRGGFRRSHDFPKTYRERVPLLLKYARRSAEQRHVPVAASREQSSPAQGVVRMSRHNKRNKGSKRAAKTQQRAQKRREEAQRRNREMASGAVVDDNDMRALEGLAQTLWTTGRREDAVAHYREMLRLNPNDNQGVRYVLTPKLLELGRFDEFEKLTGQYDEDSTFWLYSKSLAIFRKGGDTPASRKLLSQAIKQNHHVPPYLTGQVPPVGELPSGYSWGSEEEAQIYAFEARAAWRSVPGAVAWLRKVAGVRLYAPDPAAPPPPRTNDLLALPQDADEVWQCDVRMDADLLGPESAETGWVVIVLSLSQREIPGVERHRRKPSVNTVWKDLCRVMADPVTGEPRRPGLVRFMNPKLLESLEGKLDRLGISAGIVEEADLIDAVFDEIRNRQEQSVRDDRPLPEIPQVLEEVWQVDCRQMNLWLEGDAGDVGRPWTAIVTCPADDSVIHQALSPEQPSMDEIWDLIETGIRQPSFGESHRPGRVEVRSADHRLALAERLEDAGIDCAINGDLEHWDSVYANLARHMEGRPSLTPYVQVPGLTPQQIGSFFEAAADYYRRAPWHRTPVDSVIELRLAGPRPRVWYAVVMGQNGMTTGLALYDDADHLRKTMTGEIPPEAGLEGTSALSLMYSEEFELAGADLDAAEQFGWPVAAPEAYPLTLRVRPGQPPSTPSADELSVMESALRLVPEFVASDRSPLTRTVSLNTGSVTVMAQWKRF
jgi:tetratricopeptide (TPR) repeat protein